MRVGVAGLGRMGSAIAARLMAAGHKVTVWNPSALAGGAHRGETLT
jgi:3-hydroxyisobutyrate dehydrogenase-like beta-hydroxyacid dehydrogenase